MRDKQTTWLDLAEMIGNNVHPVVRFTKSKVLDVEIETYFEPNMMAKLIAVEAEHDDSFKLTFDVREYHTYNQALETRIYYDNEGQPTLTASEAGFSPEKSDFLETVYVDVTWPVESLLTIVDNKSVVLYQLFTESPRKDQIPYVGWLEEMLCTSLHKDDDTIG